MNDTMKLALGVTGFASLLVLAVPSNFDVSQTDQQVQENPSPIAEKSASPKPVISKPRTEIIVEDDEDEDFSFGDPIASTDPIDFDDFDKDTNNETDSSTPVHSTVRSTAQNKSSAKLSSNTQSTDSQPSSTSTNQNSLTTSPPPRKTVGTGGKPVNSNGVSIKDAR